jgi:mono/diheme cytochrome c family protein
MKSVWREVVHVASLVAFFAVIGMRLSSGQSAAPERSTADGVYTEDQANRGQALFGRKCHECHGDTLEGGSLAPSLRGSEFLALWHGKPLRRLYSRIISTMPPDDAGSLSESETLDLVALVLRTNGSPAGSRPLADADELNSIVVAASAGKRDEMTLNAETAESAEQEFRISLRAPRALRSSEMTNSRSTR